MLWAAAIVVVLAAVAATGAATGAASASGDDVEGVTTPPVPVRTSLLLTPWEAAGTGLAPEAEVQVAVDERGRVTAVEMLSIEPSTDLDDAFRRALEAAVGYWRYAPATRDGEPVATTLSWTVQFQPKAPGRQQAQFEMVGLRPDPDERRERIAALTLEQRRQLLTRWSKVAEKQLVAEHRRRTESPRFVVVSDAERPETVETIAGNLEASFAILDQLFEGRLQGYPEPYKNLVYVYQDRASFHALAAELHSWERPEGMYLAPGFLAFHLEVRSSDSFLHSLLHEAVHAYSDRHLRRPGASFPLWMEEGFAEYIGNSEIKRGELRPGRTLKGKYVLAHQSGAYRQATDAGLSLDEVQRALRKDEGLTLPELVGAERPVFYGARRWLFYAQSWLLVHFLRHGDEGWATERFPDLLLYMAEGYPAEAALAAAYGATAEQLDARFQEYAREF